MRCRPWFLPHRFEHVKGSRGCMYRGDQFCVLVRCSRCGARAWRFLEEVPKLRTVMVAEVRS